MAFDLLLTLRLSIATTSLGIHHPSLADPCPRKPRALVPNRSHLDRVPPLRRGWSDRNECGSGIEARADPRVQRPDVRHYIAEWNGLGACSGGRDFTGEHRGPHLGRQCPFLCLRVFRQHWPPARNWRSQQ